MHDDTPIRTTTTTTCTCGPDAGAARASDGWRCVQCGRRLGDEDRR